MKHFAPIVWFHVLAFCASPLFAQTTYLKAASQSQVNAGVANDVGVTPKGLAGYVPQTVLLSFDALVSTNRYRPKNEIPFFGTNGLNIYVNGNLKSWASNKVLYVTTNGNDTTGTRGDPTKPFASIGYWQVDVFFLAGVDSSNVFSPTGALSKAQSGDVILVCPGWHSNYFCALWKTGYNAGVSMIGYGPDFTHLFMKRSPGTNVFMGPNLGGQFIQFGNSSVSGNYSITQSFGAGNFGSGQAAYQEFVGYGPTPEGPGSPNLRQTIRQDPNDDYATNNLYYGATNFLWFNTRMYGYSDCLYIDGNNQQLSGAFTNLYCEGAWDSGAHFGISNAFLKFGGCRFNTKFRPEFIESSAYNLQAVTVNKGTNFFYDCDFFSSAPTNHTGRGLLMNSYGRPVAESAQARTFLYNPQFITTNRVGFIGTQNGTESIGIGSENVHATFQMFIASPYGYGTIVGSNIVNAP